MKRDEAMPKLKRIYVEDNDYQHLDVLKRNREKRGKYEEFFIEGVRSIDRALEYGWEIVAFAYSSQRKLSNWANEILGSSQAAFHYDLPPHLLDKLSEKEESSELIAIASMPRDGLFRIRIHDDLLVVVMDRPANHGNLGAIIRACDSFKADGVIISGHGVDPYDPQTIRASVGSFFALPVVKIASHQELHSWFADVRTKYTGLRVVGTSAKAELIVSEGDLTGPMALMLGNESEGLSNNLKGLCDYQLRIPIHGSATSLNVACAASIFLYEIDRQRKLAP